MNGKQAKRLRRAALGLATTLSETGKDIKKDGYQVKKHDSNLAPPVITMTDTGQEIEQRPPPTYQLLVRKDSLKGIYKTLKSGKA